MKSELKVLLKRGVIYKLVVNSVPIGDFRIAEQWEGIAKFVKINAEKEIVLAVDCGGSIEDYEIIKISPSLTPVPEVVK